LTLGLAGDYAEAERVLREVIDLPPCECNYTYATLGYVLGLAGRKTEARTILAELERQRERDYVSPVGLAMIELGLGNLDRALDWTEIAFAERRGWLAYLNVNPVFDSLRGHPRFNDLVRRMKL
jgi:serine/threonine-protein kinase